MQKCGRKEAGRENVNLECPMMYASKESPVDEKRKMKRLPNSLDP